MDFLYQFSVLNFVREFIPKYLTISRSSRSKVFYKKGVHRNFAKFTEKHLCQSHFLNKVSGLRPAKKRLWHRCFPVNFAKFLRTAFSLEHLWWLLLTIRIFTPNSTQSYQIIYSKQRFMFPENSFQAVMKVTS